MFVKLAPIDPAHREMIGATGMGEREAQFYADVAPTVNVVVPGCSFAASEGDRFVLLLEDLSVRGSRFASNGEWGITADAAAGALEDLAVFHARFEDAADATGSRRGSPRPRPSMSEATSGPHALGARRERGASSPPTTPPSASSTSSTTRGSTRSGTRVRPR